MTFAPAPENEFACEVRAGLTNSPRKTLPCRFFYDEVGSALFEAITCLPEYGLARADARLLRNHAGEIAEGLPRETLVAELGSGSGVKTRAVLEQLRMREPAVSYCPIDLSPAALARCANELGHLAEVRPVEAGYIEGLGRVTADRVPGRGLLVLFLGSSIGNFEPQAALEFLSAVRAALMPGDKFLLGTDLVKSVGRMIAAYDDAAGVTAAFNLNLLLRINRELGADFDPRRFAHLARYDRAAQRIEMHLVSRGLQVVNIPAAGISVAFDDGETIWTEACHKFRPSQIRAMAHASGFRVDRQWIDREWPFAETLLAAV